MADIQERIQTLATRWEEVYEAAQQNTQLWEQHYPDLSLDEVNDIVGTISRLFGRVRAPAGFSAGYEAAKASALASMPNIDAQLNQLVAQKYNHVRNFVTQLNQLLGASLTLFITGSTGEEGRQLSSLAGDIAEAAERAERATKELEAKAAALETRAEEIAIREERLDALDSRATVLEAVLTELTETRASALGFRDAVETAATEAGSTIATLTQRNADTEALSHDASTAKTKLEGLVSEAESIRATIEGLLPGSASVGLAASFEERANKLVIPRRGWMTVFIVTILAMVGVAFSVDLSGDDYWHHAFTRLPFLAPLVWLGWFSALQYGNTIRLEEDYRFKTSTAKAFIGYRDHMAHLKDVDLENAGNALALLSARTVEVLSIEPGRLLGKSHNEATPSGGILGLTSARRSKEAEES